MKKKKVLLLVAVVCIAALFVGVYADNLVKKIKAELRKDFTIVIDGQERLFENVDGEVVYPILYEGTTYLPVRAIGELMDKDVYWFEEDKRIELRNKKTTVTDADVIITEESNKKSESDKEKPKADYDENFIGIEKAKEIVLEKAKLEASAVIFEKVELDIDRGVWLYEIEFKKGYAEYEADVNATDGTILKWEVDLDD